MSRAPTDQERDAISEALTRPLDDGVSKEDVLEECEYVIDNYGGDDG
jgi:hypothetical protein